MQLTKEQLDAEILDWEDDPAPREQILDRSTGKITVLKTWTYRALLLSVAYNSDAKDKNGDLIYSAGTAISSCRNGETECTLTTEEANALITALNADDRFKLGLRKPVENLLNGKSPNGEAPKTE